MRSTLLCACLLLLASGCRPQRGAGDAAAEAFGGDAAIFRKIRDCRKIARKLAVDGSAEDWRGIPEFPGGPADGGAGPFIASAAVAPLDDALLVLLKGTSFKEADFQFAVDVDGGPAADFLIDVRSSDALVRCREYQTDRRLGFAVTLKDARARIAEGVLELRVPLAELAFALSPELFRAMRGKDARSWVRVKTAVSRAGVKEDGRWGPAPASYRFAESLRTLDGPLPALREAPRALEFPFRRPAYVMQGAFGAYSHAGVWAVDLAVLLPSGFTSDPAESKTLEDYAAWDGAVLAPRGGTVFNAASGFADHAPGVSGDSQKANHLDIEFEPSIVVDVFHLKQGSVALKKGDAVAQGAEIGRIGNSGSSTEPHVHLAVWDIRPHATVPWCFRNVVVGLNAGEGDPWRRRVAAWIPQAGFVVRPAGGAP